MTQQIINIGAAPNDGEGDNLRTAFDKVNDNFSNVWAQGPVGSNVRIQGNTISTLQVNQDLVLSPNGVGNVRLNNNTIPGANNTWFLGSSTNRWRGLYVGNIDANNVSINSGLTVPGDAYIGGNLTVEGDTIQIGNIVTDTKTIQLANTAANAIQANGSGITVGASDNIATFLYNSTSNSWVTNLPITYANGQPIGKTPGGSNTYIQFNDAGNFGGNANFTYNRATGNFYLGGANLRAVAGNSQPYILQVPGIAFQGGSAIMEWDAVNQHVDVSNSFSISGTLQLYGNYPGDGAVITTSGGSGVDITIEPSGNLYLNADGGEVIVSDQTASVDTNTGALKVLGGVGVNGNINVGGNITGANITANYFVGNGSLLTGVSSYANANVAAYGEAGWAGNIIPSANATYSLGNTTTRRWKDINLSGNINIGAANISTVPGNLQTAVLSVPGISFLGGNAIMEWDPTNQHVDISNSFSVSGTLALYGNYPGTGALIATSGGSGVDIKIEPSGNLYLNADGGEVIVSDQTVSVDPNTGALKVLGGVGVNGNINAGGNITGNYFIGNGSQLTNLPSTDWANIGNITNANGPQNIAIGENVHQTFTYTPGFGTVAIGYNAGQTNQGGLTVAVGWQAGQSNQSNNAIAIGYAAGQTGQEDGAVAIGAFAGAQLQGADAIAIGKYAGYNGVGVAQPDNTIFLNATGTNMGGVPAQTNSFYVAPIRNDVANVAEVMFYNTTSKEITYGNVISVAGNITGGNVNTGKITLTNGAVIRDTAGDAVAIGQQAGETSQGNYAVAMGFQAAITSQGIGAVAIGREAGNAQGAYAVAIGQEAGFAGQSSGAIAIGLEAGNNNQGGDSVAIGYRAGGEDQDIYAVAIGYQAGNNTQGGSAVAIGEMAGTDTQGVSAVAVGDGAGRITQGEYAVALGYGAGDTNQGNNSIIINATGGILNQTTANTFTVAPIRNDVANVAEVVFYNTTSKEITYGNAISVTGNISGGNIITAGNITGNTAGFALGYRDIPQVAFTANATIATTDAGKHFYSTQSTDYILTIANNASQGFATGAAITVINQGTGNITVAQGSGVTLYLAGNATSGNRTVATFGMATIMKVATDTWFINGTGVS